MFIDQNKGNNYGMVFNAENATLRKNEQRRRWCWVMLMLLLMLIKDCAYNWHRSGTVMA